MRSFFSYGNHPLPTTPSMARHVLPLTSTADCDRILFIPASIGSHKTQHSCTEECRNCLQFAIGVPMLHHAQSACTTSWTSFQPNSNRSNLARHPQRCSAHTAHPQQYCCWSTVKMLCQWQIKWWNCDGHMMVQDARPTPRKAR
jgi:hypothetical protein